MNSFSFRGLSAFPLTPTSETGIDERAVAAMVERAVRAGVDSIGALGSTGGYAYLDREQRRRVARVAVNAASGTPVMVGVGALRTQQVRQYVDEAQAEGAAAVLLAPVSYQPLTDDEVFGLYEDISAAASVPVCVYDNPATTGFSFSDELHAAIAELPNIAAVKIPPSPAEHAEERITTLRNALRPGTVIGVSGDWFAAPALIAGADAWFSVVAGLFPEVAVAITQAALNGSGAEATRLSADLEPLWTLFRRHGSLRVMATASELLGLTARPSLPRPLRELDQDARQAVAETLGSLRLQ
ncbi:dihydrodipicolinate synthase family protein [Arthrobacter sp. I2-34]|uniref:Dihydrodipicolinate synthase family protein n=1 Tax=Arthrobacter hankyongi TaxID=2904801 RepID=A0ABS9LAK7_9MICC|nr:dihydrodipicolinate synthase family protein [Arthrobacter hankyongi]MCG2623717.1 dihydrodipicolinate synthase family protein [Arthrobacter hankyongi]